MAAFQVRLIEALDKAAQAHRDKAWTRGLADFNALAKDFNTRIEVFTGKKLGTSLLPIPKESLAPVFEEKHNAYRFVLVGSGRTEIKLLIGIFAIAKNGNYPVLVLNDNLQIMGLLPDKEALEDQFVMFLRMANSQFMQIVLAQALVAP